MSSRRLPWIVTAVLLVWIAAELRSIVVETFVSTTASTTAELTPLTAGVPRTLSEEEAAGTHLHKGAEKLPRDPPTSTATVQNVSPKSLTVQIANSPAAGVADHDRHLQHPQEFVFQRTLGRNPPNCGVDPNATEIPPYRGCPLPGLNNLLFTQVNRWYCAVRDNRVLHLRDRSCNKGSEEPFRYSTLLQIDYEALERTLPSRRNAAICWSDIARQDKAPQCEWGDVPKFYATELWWTVRRTIDFHPTYYRTAERFVQTTFSNRPFLAVHLRRGDYQQHCVVIKRRGVPPWISFAKVRKLYDFERGCYPSLALVEETLVDWATQRGLADVFIATNTPDEFEPLAQRLAERASSPLHVVVGILARFFSSVDRQPRSLEKRLRKLDQLVVEVIVLSLGRSFLFNRYSSLSAMAYEIAAMHGRIKQDSQENFACW